MFSTGTTGFIWSGSEQVCLWNRNWNEKSAQRRKHCTLAAVRRSQKFIDPLQIPSSGARDGQNLISWRWSLPLPINPVWWGSMHALLSYHGNRPTPPVRHRQGRLQYTALQLSVQWKKKSEVFYHVPCCQWSPSTPALLPSVESQ